MSSRVCCCGGGGRTLRMAGPPSSSEGAGCWTSSATTRMGHGMVGSASSGLSSEGGLVTEELWRHVMRTCETLGKAQVWESWTMHCSGRSRSLNLGEPGELNKYAMLGPCWSQAGARDKPQAASLSLTRAALEEAISSRRPTSPLWRTRDYVSLNLTSYHVLHCAFTFESCTVGSFHAREWHCFAEHLPACHLGRRLHAQCSETSQLHVVTGNRTPWLAFRLRTVRKSSSCRCWTRLTSSN